MSNMQSYDTKATTYYIFFLEIIKLFELHATRAKGYIHLRNEGTLRQMLYKSLNAIIASEIQNFQIISYLDLKLI